MHKQSLLLALVSSSMLIMAACGGAAAPAAPAAPTTPPAEAAAPTEVADTASTAADAPADAGFQTYALVPGESKAMYMVDEEFFGGALGKYGIAAGEYDIVGTTDQIEGELLLDLAQLTIGPSEFRVNMTTLSTDQNRRDNWIREQGPRFNSFPTAHFVTTGVENAPATYSAGEAVTFQLTGDMTIREVTQSLTFDVTATLDGDTIRGTATTTTLMSNFGIDPPNFANTLTVQDQFKIQVDFVAQAQ